PANQCVRHGDPRCHPDVPSRILEQARQVVMCQAVTRFVDRFGRSSPEIFKTDDPPEPVESLACGNPPLAGVVLDRAAQAAPACVGYTCGQGRPDCSELSAVEPADEPSAAAHVQLAVPILDDRADRLSETIAVAISGPRMRRNLQCSAGVRAHPEIAFAVADDGTDVVAYAPPREIRSKHRAIELGQTGTNSAYPHPAVARFVHRHDGVVVEPIAGR